MTKILIVDDEVEITELSEHYLKNEGYRIVKLFNGDDAIKYIRENDDISLAILDVMLPGADGFEILRFIRESRYFPVIMLTAKVADMDKINGLSLGADDYITKPFNPLELVARVKAQLRRVNTYSTEAHFGGESDRGTYIDVGSLHIDIPSRSVYMNSKLIRLTKYEYNILLYLAENRGRVIDSEELFESVWKEKYLDNNNTVMAHIARLREKLGEDARKPKIIKTVWGVGYIIDEK